MACQGEGNYNVHIIFPVLQNMWNDTWPVREKEIIMYMSHFLCSRTCVMTRGLSGEENSEGAVDMSFTLGNVPQNVTCLLQDV